MKDSVTQKTGTTILLAEDYEMELELFTHMLERAGFRVIPCLHGGQALEELESGRRVDAIATDIYMPHKTGLDLARYNFENARLPFLMFTGVADARVALSMLEYGVNDFLLKPFGKDKFIAMLKNALTRKVVRENRVGDESAYDGNVGEIDIPAVERELSAASRWMEKKLEKILPPKESDILNSYIFEFLQNAYEHGSLGIGEDLKSRLLEEGRFSEEVARREKECRARIKLKMSALTNEVLTEISDQGEGFDYERFLSMTREHLLERLSMPNGRGIFMARSYFDDISYSNGGSTVTLQKKLGTHT